MKRFFLTLAVSLSAVAQPLPSPPATQTEVNAGVNTFKHVTPATLAGYISGGGGSGATTNNAQFLLFPPNIGASTNLGAYAANNTAGVMIPGAGILRNVWIQAEIGTAADLNSKMTNLWLEIFVDGGNTTNLAFRTVRANLADMFGNRYRQGAGAGVQWCLDRDSFGIYSQDRSTNANYGGYIKTMELRLPVLYTNNVLLRITNASAANTLYNGGYFSVAYEKAADLSAFGALQTWRLRSQNTNGAFVANASNFLFSTTGPGICVGWLQGMSGTDSSQLENFVDSVSVAFKTSPSTVWQSTGFDDFSLSTFAMKAGITTGWKAGVTDYWTANGNPGAPKAVEFYRWFTTDTIFWPDGLTVFIPDSQTLAHGSITMFYYAP